MLQMIKLEVELIPDRDMYIFFEKSTRGGISYISNTYKKADNEYLKSYDSKHESKHVIYLNLNKFLQTGEFKWIDPKEFNFNKYSSNSLKRSVLEVDHEYPKELQKLQNDYPVVSDKI